MSATTIFPLLICLVGGTIPVLFSASAIKNGEVYSSRLTGPVFRVKDPIGFWFAIAFQIVFSLIFYGLAIFILVVAVVHKH